MGRFECIVRLVLGCIFLAGALPKIRQPYDFLDDVYRYELVGPKVGMLVAMALPWTELLVGICLLGSVFVGGALLVSAGLGAIFTLAVSWALFQGLDIGCGCFGASSHKINSWTLMRAILVLFLSVVALLIWLLYLRRNTVLSPLD
ncbi:MAG: MauE/DoxX family redox-associated membrane protein [Acetivibrionales bacterium]|jgi:hypothetical protein